MTNPTKPPHGFRSDVYPPIQQPHSQMLDLPLGIVFVIVFTVWMLAAGVGALVGWAVALMWQAFG